MLVITPVIMLIVLIVIMVNNYALIGDAFQELIAKAVVVYVSNVILNAKDAPKIPLPVLAVI